MVWFSISWRTVFWRTPDALPRGGECMAAGTAISHALVLSGGGSYGAYEAGVIKALIAGAPGYSNSPVDPAIITATSAGAFNAAALLSAPDGTAAAAAEC